jgi:hypothetical protein
VGKQKFKGKRTEAAKKKDRFGVELFLNNIVLIFLVENKPFYENNVFVVALRDNPIAMLNL